MESLDGLYVLFTLDQEFHKIDLIFWYDTISHPLPLSFCRTRTVEIE